MNAETSTPPAPVARARRAGRFVALASAAVLALAGCGAGQISETAVQHPTIGGSDADLGRLALRNMQIEAAPKGGWEAGDNVALTLAIVNNTSADDQLVGITTDAADEVLIFADTEEYLAYLGSQAPTATPTATASGSATPTAPATTAGATETPTGSGPNANQSTDPAATSGTGTGSAPSPSPSATRSAAVLPSGEVTVPVAGSVYFGYDGGDKPVILLVGIKEPLAGGNVISLTFTFATGGSVTAAVPVALTEGSAEDAPVLDLHHGGEAGTEDEDH